jgi:hypothetical protein
MSGYTNSRCGPGVQLDTSQGEVRAFYRTLTLGASGAHRGDAYETYSRVTDGLTVSPAKEIR